MAMGTTLSNVVVPRLCNAKLAMTCESKDVLKFPCPKCREEREQSHRQICPLYRGPAWGVYCPLLYFYVYLDLSLTSAAIIWRISSCCLRASLASAIASLAALMFSSVVSQCIRSMRCEVFTALYNWLSSCWAASSVHSSTVWVVTIPSRCSVPLRVSSSTDPRISIVARATSSWPSCCLIRCGGATGRPGCGRCV